MWTELVSSEEDVMHPRLNLVLLVVWTGFVLMLMPAAPARCGRGGPDAFGYTWIDSNEPDGPALEDLEFDSFISDGAGTADWLSAPIPLPFRFFFYEQGYDTFQISDNGWAAFVPQADPFPTPTPMPAAGLGPSGFVAPFWTDLALIRLDHGPILGGDGYRVYWLGIAPTRLATDVILDLFKDGRIRFTYVRARAIGEIAVGIESHDESAGFGLVYRDEVAEGFAVTDYYAVEFTPPQLLACDTAIPISCGETLVAEPPALPSAPDSRVYCASGSYRAAETVFRLELDRPLDVEVSISGFDGRDLDVFFLDGCREVDCRAGGRDRLLHEVEQAGTYFLVVDGLESADEGPFEISVECFDPYLELACGDVVSDSTVGRSSRRDAHPCNGAGPAFEGGDVQHVICIPRDASVRLSLDTTAELDLVVYQGDVRPESCVAWGDDAVTLFGTEAGCYYVFVDGPVGGSGEYTLRTSCRSLLDCAEAIPLGCGDTVVGDTSTAPPGLVELYPCSLETYDGPELLHSFVNPIDQNVSFVLSGAAPEVDLLLARGCDEGFCFRVAGDTLHVADLPAGEYSVFVDGRDGAAGDFTLSATCGRSLSPTSIDISLEPGQVFPETKQVQLTPDIPQTDIMVIFDSTSSMREEIPNVKNHVAEISARLTLLQDDIQFGVIKFEDYYQTYAGLDNCGYEAEFGGYYGWMQDLPYVLRLPLTADVSAFEAAVWAVATEWGRDGYASYSRALWETVHDETIGWRPGSRRFVLLFGDTLPHDCELDACVGGGLLAEPSTGKDPGRDEMINTSDDIAILDALAEMADDRNDIVLLHFDSSANPDNQAIWACWAERTSGSSSILDANGSPLPPLSVADTVLQVVTDEMTRCDTLTLSPSAGFEEWLISIDPALLSDVLLPATTDFRIVLGPPLGTPPGIHVFTMDLHCDGVLIAQQDVTIHVGDCALATLATAEPMIACQGTPVALDAEVLVADACDGDLHYRWFRDGVLIRDFDSSPTAVDLVGLGASTYVVEMACIDGSTCAGSSTAVVEVFGTRDPTPPPLGPSLRVIRQGASDVLVTWQDLPLPEGDVGSYELVALDDAPDLDPTPLAMDAATILQVAPPGVGEAAHVGAAVSPCRLGPVSTPCRLLFYKVRAASPCNATPGPTCNGFPRQATCP